MEDHLYGWLEAIVQLVPEVQDIERVQSRWEFFGLVAAFDLPAWSLVVVVPHSSAWEEQVFDDYRVILLK